ncbi:hypothetical protein [Xanthocytophaga agilis]|uniref:Uncharacterized protein n=1 Tax=Xanthocytophaga agilis TaxID=3048010 RepID=A0AAE3UH38_9BACT|nr:hypothetical protein [Xanthocytophaga agilis]MDJ1505035.1 hypothetical protein [Xanthocytophaga agilis]
MNTNNHSFYSLLKSLLQRIVDLIRGKKKSSTQDQQVAPTNSEADFTFVQYDVAETSYLIDAGEQLGVQIYTNEQDTLHSNSISDVAENNPTIDHQQHSSEMDHTHKMTHDHEVNTNFDTSYSHETTHDFGTTYDSFSNDDHNTSHDHGISNNSGTNSDY